MRPVCYPSKGDQVAREYLPVYVREEVGGVKVVKDEVLESGLSAKVGRPIPMHGTRVLTLEDGTVTYGCRECPVTGTRGEVRKHRYAEHGATLTDAAGKPGPIQDSPITGRLQMTGETLSMTVYELLELAVHVGEWETAFGNQEQQVEDLRDKLVTETVARKTAERELAALKRRLQKLVGSGDE